MKDITRIHIAKIAYSIELDAKKVLEKYIASLEAHIDDKEVLDDIEIRITELLAEHGVKPDGVITIAEVNSVRTQLGNPKDFMDDDISSGAIDIEVPHGNNRRLYRNLDTALLGGVLGGIASFIGVNALWVRLVFVVLTLFSFGFMILLYGLLWLLLPPARTAAERLQMQGIPVTLSSIRALNESSPAKDYKRRSRIIKRIITITLGIVSVGAAITTTIVMVAIWLTTSFTVDDGKTYRYFKVYEGYETTNPLSLGLAYGSGFLLVLLCVLVAYAFFAQKFTKRIWVSGIVAIVLGVLSITSAYGVALHQKWQFDQEVQQSITETSIKTPAGFESVSSLIVDIPSAVELLYVADNPTGSITVRSAKGLTIDASVQDSILRIKFPSNPSMVPSAHTTLTIHGPRLTSIISNQGNLSYKVKNQDILKIEAHNESNVSILDSSIGALTALLDGSAHLLAESGTIESVNLDLRNATYVSLGNIKQFTLSSTDACAADSPINVYIQSVKNPTFTYNDQQVPSVSLTEPCSAITIGSSQANIYN